MGNENRRLIYANDPLKQLSDYMEKLHCPDDYRDGLYRGMEIAESYIKNAPTVDAVEVVHGRWIEDQVEGFSPFGGDSYLLDVLQCSVCGEYFDVSEARNYCPNRRKENEYEGKLRRM